MTKAVKKTKSSKSRSITSANLTGGKGFSFENEVGAWFLVHMLAGVSPLDTNLGTLKQLSFQTEALHWKLDDLLLTYEANSIIQHCAISIKSNRQFTAKKAPEDFVERCWLQFLEAENSPFCAKTDRLINITSKLPQSTEDSLSQLLYAARVRNPSEMKKQLENGDLSENSRSLFNSFKCPAKLIDKYKANEVEVSELLRCIIVLPLDLESDESADKVKALTLCRQIVRTGELSTAIELWEALVSLVDKHRVDRGHIDLATVLCALRHRIPLKDHPDYAADWSRLCTDSKDRWESVNDLIAGKTSLPRNSLLQEIESTFLKHSVVVLLGEQGGGKSVAARRWAELRSSGEPTLWFDPRILEISDLSELRERLKITHPWRELVAGLARPHVSVILDGLDRLIMRSDAMKAAGLLLDTLLINKSENPFFVLITCQEQAWDEVQVALLQSGQAVTQWPKIMVKPVNSGELSTLVADFPALRSLSYQERLISILHQPKILDLLARNSMVANLPDFRNWAGESDVIDWVWQAEIARKKPQAARQRLMWQLAEKQAERLSVDVPLDELGDVVDVALDSLETDRICQSKDGRVTFCHDLWGDWARQRLLLAHETELPGYMQKRLDNPAWHRATVLFGLDLLERRAVPERWRELMERSELLENGGTIFCDLLLESLIRAAQTTDAFTQAWQQLSANEGIWLRRLLTRFLHVATSPNPAILEYARSKEGLSETWAASVNRRPKPILWGPMLRFLSSHREECADLAPLQVAEIANCWLCFTPINMVLRDEAADLALTVAWQTLRQNQHWRFRDYSTRRHSRGELKAIAKKAYFA